MFHGGHIPLPDETLAALRTVARFDLHAATVYYNSQLHTLPYKLHITFRLSRFALHSYLSQALNCRVDETSFIEIAPRIALKTQMLNKHILSVTSNVAVMDGYHHVILELGFNDFAELSTMLERAAHDVYEREFNQQLEQALERQDG